MARRISVTFCIVHVHLNWTSLKQQLQVSKEGRDGTGGRKAHLRLHMSFLWIRRCPLAPEFPAFGFEGFKHILHIYYTVETAGSTIWHQCVSRKVVFPERVVVGSSPDKAERATIGGGGSAGSLGTGRKAAACGAGHGSQSADSRGCSGEREVRGCTERTRVGRCVGL